MNNILNYFDLNKRTRGSQGIDLYGIDKLKKEVSDKIISEKIKEVPVPVQKAIQMPLVEQLLMYFGIVIGVLFSSTVAQFGSGGFKFI